MDEESHLDPGNLRVTRVLILDEDAGFRRSCAQALSGPPYEVLESAAIPGLRGESPGKGFDVIIVGSGSADGVDPEILRRLKGHSPDARVLVLAREGTIEGAVRAMRQGASDYVPKPVEAGDLRRRVDQLGRGHPKGVLPGEAPPSRTASEVVSPGLVGSSPAMEDLRRLILKVASAESTALVTGETGTGKELVARAIHLHSPRRHAPFVAINCGAIPETLLESQLFGHERGAFTGADRDREGLFRSAGEGTIFLDEIGELPMALQPKILRALDAREFLPVGSTQPQAVRARVLVATNRDLRLMVATGRFREDLFYRLSTVEIPIAPLRSRPEDIAPTATFLLDRAARGLRRRAPSLSPAALAALEAHGWPGNVRELSNVLERALILSPGESIALEDLPALLAADSPPASGHLRTARRAFERMFARRAVEACKGDKIRAAKLIGISLPSLYRKLCLPAAKRPGST